MEMNEFPVGDLKIWTRSLFIIHYLTFFHYSLCRKINVYMKWFSLKYQHLTWTFIEIGHTKMINTTDLIHMEQCCLFVCMLHFFWGSCSPLENVFPSICLSPPPWVGMEPWGGGFCIFISFHLSLRTTGWDMLKMGTKFWVQIFFFLNMTNAQHCGRGTGVTN